jgi:hypothetical protein
LQDQGIDRRMGLEWILGRMNSGGVEWIHIDQDRDQWLALVNVVMNFQVLFPRS